MGPLIQFDQHFNNLSLSARYITVLLLVGEHKELKPMMSCLFLYV